MSSIVPTPSPTAPHWVALAMFAGLTVAAVHACSDFPSTLCVPCTDTCLDGLKCSEKLGVCVPADDEARCQQNHTTGGAGQAGQAADTTSDGTQGTTSGDVGVVTNCSSAGDGCSAMIRTSGELEVACASVLSVQLEAECACGPPALSVHWTMSPELPDITLSPDGKLSGSPEAGVYEFKATAMLDGGPNARRDFTLTVTRPCRVAIVSDDPNTGEPALRAARLDGQGSGTETLPASPLADATLAGFDVSPNGEFLARIVASSQGTRLELMRTGRSETSLEHLDYSGEYLAHAFSPDSRYMALVTQESAEATERLRIFDLSTSLEETDSITVGFRSHLTWGASDWLLFFGASALQVNGALAAQEIFVRDGLVTEEHEQPDIIYFGETAFQGFLVGAQGVLTLDQTKPTFVAREGTAHYHDSIEALSPNLVWMTRDFIQGSRVDRVAEPYAEEPFATASQCALILAWSQDGSKFLCNDADRFLVYSTRESRGPLASVELEIPGGFDRRTFRMAFSDSGAWLALVPNASGMFLVKTSEFDASAEAKVLDSPVLAAPDIDEWNFFFTSREDRLVVQWGDRLLLGSLDEQGDPDFREVDGIDLASVPECSRGWFPAPDAWCGAPKFHSGWVLSRDESQLAFQNDHGNAQVVDLATGRVVDAGPVSSSCAASVLVDAPTPALSRCIQFL